MPIIKLLMNNHIVIYW